VSSAVPIAQPVVSDTAQVGLLEAQEILAPPSHRHAVVRLVGRLLALAVPVAGILLVAQAGATGLLLLGVGLASWAVVRGIRDALPPAVRFQSVTGITAGALVALAASVAIARLVDEVTYPGSTILLIALAALLVAAAFEARMERLKPPARVLVVGTDSGGDRLAQELANGAAGPKWSLVGLVVGDGRPAPGLETVVLERRPDFVVLTNSPGRDEALDALLRMPSPGFRVVSLDHFSEYAFGRVSVWSVSPLWFMSLLHAYRRPYHRVAKRALDLALALGVLLVAWPLILAVVALVRLTSPGPVFYRQVRVGEAGVPFEIFKFRTMTDGAEADGKAMWAIENDSRITTVGRTLRRYRLDELPQVWNVLRGEMSFVGPRPERPEFVEALEREIPHWTRRHLVKPGVTGWAQIRAGYAADPTGAADKLAYDLYYLKHRGLMLDLAIVARTASVVLLGKGAR
jgi:exopolysaccharide biosynthesis polyprenyl glycosylphosphotransferase